MIFQGRTFQGVRYALFAFNTAGSVGGQADFNAFTVDEPHPSGFTRPIPDGRTIVIENLRTHDVLVAKGDGLMAAPASDPAAAGVAARFTVVALPYGRVALRSQVDGRLVTVTDPGTANAVRLAAASTGPANTQVFQWTEMPRGDILFLSLASHRHLRIAATGAVTADAPGAQADRGNDASFTWRDVTDH
jgi:hypothetical protein